MCRAWPVNGAGMMLHFLFLDMQSRVEGGPQERLTVWRDGKTPGIKVGKPWSKLSLAPSWLCMTWTLGPGWGQRSSHWFSEWAADRPDG